MVKKIYEHHQNMRKQIANTLPKFNIAPEKLPS